MGTISIHLAPELQQPAGLNPSGQQAPAAAQIQPTEAEPASLGQDTVTLSPEASGEAQQTQQQRQQFRPEPILGGRAQPPVKAVAPLSPPEAEASPSLPQVSALTQLAADAANAVAGPSGRTEAADGTNAGGTAGDLATTTTGHETPPQELIQLDHTLRGLGINPQSISLTNRMSMLADANSPAALQAVVTEVRRLEQQGATPGVRNQKQAQVEDRAAADQATPSNATSGDSVATGSAPDNGLVHTNVLV
jgi:hypothetical protein